MGAGPLQPPSNPSATLMTLRSRLRGSAPSKHGGRSRTSSAVACAEARIWSVGLAGPGAMIPGGVWTVTLTRRGPSGSA